MKLRTVCIKRKSASNGYLLADWYLEKYPDAVIYTPGEFGYVRFTQNDGVRDISATFKEGPVILPPASIKGE